MKNGEEKNMETEFKESLEEWCIRNNRLDLLKEWDYDANENLTPKNVNICYTTPVHWILPYDDPISEKHFDFKWEALILNRCKGHKCPYLSNQQIWPGFNDLATRNPELAKQWHPTKNNGLLPTDVSDKSNKVVWWYYPYDDPITRKHFDFEWQASVCSRSDNITCPFLYNKVWPGFNDLATRNPELAKQWHPTKNNGLLPTDVSEQSNKMVWWYYPYDDPITRKHFDLEWQAVICDRSNSTDYPLNQKECKDHLGNVYSSISDMCGFYGITQSRYYRRVKCGWTLRETLTIPLGSRRPNKTRIPSNALQVKDHLGNIYASISEMCRHYKITKSAYSSRIERGWTLEEALTIPIGERRPNTKPLSGTAIQVKDHLGKTYDSMTEMCNAYGIALSTYINRINRGFTVEEALTFQKHKINPNIKPKWARSIPIMDHHGVQYDSITEMFSSYGIKRSTYECRIKRGWTLEEALTTPKGENRPGTKRTSKNAKQAKDHLGITYKSITEMLSCYGLSLNIYNSRIKRGWTLEEALTTPKGEDRPNINRIYRRAIESKDHLGKTYKSITDMCKAHGISISRYVSRINKGWTIEEALTIPKHMYIGEYRVAKCLKKLNAKFYHDCTIKKLFTDLRITLNWDDFINVLAEKIHQSGYNWTKDKIQKLRPDFVLYTDDNNRIRGVIEFDGEQHQNFVEHFFKTIEMFLMRSTADFVKNNLWEYLNIPMLRIRHDQIDMIDDMVLDFIKHPENYFYNHNTYLTEDEYWADLNEEKQKLDLVFAG